MKTVLLKPVFFAMLIMAPGATILNAQTDTIPPAISLMGPSADTLELKCNNPQYMDFGATAFDNRPPHNLTNAIIVTGKVNTRRPGKYELHYFVQDVSGNKTSKIRTVVVNPPKDRGFKVKNISKEVDLYYLSANKERKYFQWYVNGVKTGEKNGVESLNVFNDDILPKVVSLEEWFCDGDTSLLFHTGSGQTSRNYIKGRINNDRNGNCTEDAGDEASDAIVDLYNIFGQLINSTNSVGGKFCFNNLDSGKYKIRVMNPNMKNMLVCDPKDPEYIAGTGQDKDVVFNVQCDPAFEHDPRINHVFAGNIVPGRKFTLRTSLGLTKYPMYMNCSAPIKGKLKIEVKGKVKYAGQGEGAIAPESVDGNVFIYDIVDFAKVTANAFDMEFSTDTTATRGDTVVIGAQLFKIDVDKNPGNNIVKSEVPVRTSFDPNMVEVDPAIVEPAFMDEIVHVIHFQNTGDAEAYDVRITDTLDEKLDPASFEFLYASHAVKYSIRGHALHFHFPDIMLKDSFTNEKASHGLVAFRAVPKKGMDKTEVMKNTAHIFFDYNAAVVTNTAEVLVQEKKVGITESGIGPALTVYPNPASSRFSILYPQKAETSVEIYNVFGVLIDTVLIHNGQADYDAAKLANGLYVLRIEENGQVSSVRVQVMN